MVGRGAVRIVRAVRDLADSLPRLVFPDPVDGVSADGELGSVADHVRARTGDRLELAAMAGSSLHRQIPACNPCRGGLRLVGLPLRDRHRPVGRTRIPLRRQGQLRAGTRAGRLGRRTRGVRGVPCATSGVAPRLVAASRDDRSAQPRLVCHSGDRPDHRSDPRRPPPLGRDHVYSRHAARLRCLLGVGGTSTRR